MSDMDEFVGPYVDGELDLVTAKRFERAMADDAALRERVEQERALRDRLAQHFDRVLDETVPDSLTQMLSSNVDQSFAARRQEKERNRPGGRGLMQWAAMAATLVVGVAVGTQVTGGGWLGSSAPVETREGQLLASGDLAETLDRQLAAEASGSAEYRIGLTFRDNNGAVCRSFEGQALSGIACRGPDKWQLQRTYPGSGDNGVYRQASSTEMMTAIDAMIAGDPLDETAEKALRDSDWD